MNDEDNHVEDEIMYVRVGDMKSQYQGGYTRHENSSKMGDTPYRIKGVVGSGNSMRNWSLAANNLRKKPKHI